MCSDFPLYIEQIYNIRKFDKYRCTRLSISIRRIFLAFTYSSSIRKPADLVTDCHSSSSYNDDYRVMERHGRLKLLVNLDIVLDSYLVSKFWTEELQIRLDRHVSHSHHSFKKGNSLFYKECVYLMNGNPSWTAMDTNKDEKKKKNEDKEKRRRAKGRRKFCKLLSIIEDLEGLIHQHKWRLKQEDNHCWLHHDTAVSLRVLEPQWTSPPLMWWDQNSSIKCTVMFDLRKASPTASWKISFPSITGPNARAQMKWLPSTTPLMEAGKKEATMNSPFLDGDMWRGRPSWLSVCPGPENSLSVKGWGI